MKFKLLARKGLLMEDSIYIKPNRNVYIYVIVGIFYNNTVYILLKHRK